MKRTSLLNLTICLLPTLILLVLSVAPQVGASQTNVPLRAAAAAPWIVFTPATNTLPMSGNLLLNPGFENGSAITATNWTAYVSGYDIDATGGRIGGRALRLINAASESHGAYQIVTLNQTQTHPIYLSGWSKASGLTGDVDSNYSVYLDIRYMDDTPLYGQTINFDTGTHDWQFRERFIVPAKPIKSINVYVLLRNTHAGTAWFDDLRISEVYAEVADFDSIQVATTAPVPLPYGGQNLSLATNDGLSLTLSSAGSAAGGSLLNAELLVAQGIIM